MFFSECAECYCEITFDDFLNNNWKKDTRNNKKFHDECYHKYENTNNLFFCDRCFKTSVKNNNFIYKNNIYYHTKCADDYEICNICKLDLENEKYISVLIDYNVNKLYHTKCVENKINIFNYDICDECCKALKVKCLSCNKRFAHCYNNKCHSYSSYNLQNYNGNCENCNW